MLDTLSLNWIRFVILHFRANLFSKSKPEQMDLFLEEELEDLEELLGREHFTNIRERSFYYKGEDLNVARPDFVDDEWKWYQLHVRAWEEEDGLYISTHFELDGTVYPEEHLDGVNYEKERAIEEVHDIIENYGYDVEELR